MESTRNRSTALLALLFSLLIHVGAVILFSYSQELEEYIPILPAKRETKDQYLEWAETKARRSNFGAAVVFQDLYQEPSLKSEEPENKSSEQMNTPGKTPEEKELIDQDKEGEATTITQKKRQNTALKKVAQKLFYQKKQAQMTNKQKSKQMQQPSQKKKKLTLAQLTQGFLAHMKDEGTHAVTTIGKKGGTVTEEQLKNERYIEKLSWCLQNSFRIHNKKMPPTHQLVNNAEIFLALNQDGSIKQLVLAKSCGDVRLDQYALSLFKDASSSFPPVPHYLPHDPYTVMYIVEMETFLRKN